MRSIVTGHFEYTGDRIEVLENVTNSLHDFDYNLNDVLFRTGEQEEIARLLTYGTDRGGYPGNKIWPYSEEYGKEIFHEDIIYGTTYFEIKDAENEGSESPSSLKKFEIIENPTVIAYDKSHFEKVMFKQYMFKNPNQKLDALIGVFVINKNV